jgi:hypothetical protein
MLNEKHFDSFDWQNKLEEMNSLPAEEIIDKHAAWEKLHTRLQEKPRRKRMIWYWAAACLLLAIMIAIKTTNSKNVETATSNPMSVQTENVAIPKISFLKPDSNIDRFSVSIQKNKFNKHPSQRENRNSFSGQVSKERDSILPILVNQKSLLPEQIIPLPPISDTPIITVLATASVKRKLKVVHNNELDNSGENASNMSRILNYRSLKITSSSQEVYTSSSLISNYIGFNIINTKKPAN